MSNLLKMAKIEAILTLERRNWTVRLIAKVFRIHSDTLAGHFRQQELPAKTGLDAACRSLN